MKVAVTRSVNDAFWPPRLPRHMEPPATAFCEALAVNAARYPKRSALTFLGAELSYARLAEAVESLAASLQEFGIEKGDRVLIVMQNCPQLVIAQYAVARANAVTVPINPMSTPEELRHYISDSQARAAITTGDLAIGLARASNGLAQGSLERLIVSQFPDALDGLDDDVPESWRQWLQQRHPQPTLRSGEVYDFQSLIDTEKTPSPLSVARGDLALLPYTSGTTGAPKGCILTHGNLTHNAFATNAWLSMTHECSSLVAVPMFHITGLVCVMHATIFVGGQLVIMPRWDRTVARHLIRKHQVSHWSCIPTMIIDLLADPALEKADLASLKYLGGGGAAMPEAVAQRLLDLCGTKFTEGYGLTETSAVSILNPCDAPKLQCLGIPFMSTAAHILDIETDEEQPPGIAGEIVLRGPQVFSGYWRNEGATREAFVELNGDLFFRSGDIGYVDEDGYFFITDRLKRMINASGYKVWPAEVEARMYHHPGIQEACIIGVSDPYRGETVKAIVVRRATHPTLSEGEIIEWCRGEMSAYKVPRSIRFANALPKGASGKVLWRKLQESERNQLVHAARGQGSDH